jgi:hypothetical protein
MSTINRRATNWGTAQMTRRARHPFNAERLKVESAAFAWPAAFPGLAAFPVLAAFPTLAAITSARLSPDAESVEACNTLGRIRKTGHPVRTREPATERRCRTRRPLPSGQVISGCESTPSDTTPFATTCAVVSATLLALLPAISLPAISPPVAFVAEPALSAAISTEAFEA